MRKLKKKHLGPYCSFCEERTTRAVYVMEWPNNVFSCESHKEHLITYDISTQYLEEHLTEADYQTWHK